MQSKLPAPEGFLLGRIRWDFFVTLTHTSKGLGRWRNPSARSSSIAWATWTRAIIKKFKINKNSLRWVRRWEQGRGGREHFHALINFHNAKLCSYTTGRQLKDIWEHRKECVCKPSKDPEIRKKEYLTCRFGRADVRLCESAGVKAYITKLQNEYEMNRFGADRFRHVDFSKSAQKALRRQLEGVSVHTGY